jgi:hypothetical protein
MQSKNVAHDSSSEIDGNSDNQIAQRNIVPEGVRVFEHD